MNALLTAIFVKFNAANSFKTAIGGRMYSRYAPQNTIFPYAVIFFPTMTGDRDFTKDYDNVDVQFNLFSKSTSEIEIGNMLKYLQALFDSATLSVTGYTHLYMEYDMAWMLSEPEDNIREYAVQYNILLEH